jgi:hypothetical protein
VSKLHASPQEFYYVSVRFLQPRGRLELSKGIQPRLPAGVDRGAIPQAFSAISCRRETLAISPGWSPGNEMVTGTMNMINGIS